MKLCLQPKINKNSNNNLFSECVGCNETDLKLVTLLVSFIQQDDPKLLVWQYLMILKHSMLIDHLSRPQLVQL
jgi:hypothetical protein